MNTSHEIPEGNHGEIVEEFVDYLCQRSFFADFTFRSPKFYKTRGREKEAADVLVAFEDTLLAIQVRSKHIDANADGGIASGIEHGRIKREIDRATNKFRDLGKALQNANFKFLTNGRGIKVPFDKSKVTKLVLIVVFAPIWRNKPKEPLRFRFDRNPYLEDDLPIPLHYFALDELKLLTTLLDTLPDFLAYLDARWFLRREKLISPRTDVADEWAFVTFERPTLLEILRTRRPIDLGGLHKKHCDLSSTAVLEAREKPSYLVDHLIETLNLTVASGRKLRAKFKAKKHLAPPNSQEGLRILVPHLAKLNRQERTMLTEAFLNKVVECLDCPPVRFRAMKFERHEEGFLVLASTFKREGKVQACLWCRRRCWREARR